MYDNKKGVYNMNLNKPGVRYNLDFRLMPELFFREPAQFFNALEMGKEEFFLNIFNHFYSEPNDTLFKDKPVRFSVENFKVTKYLLSKSKFMYYVELPAICEDSLVWCEAYGFIFDLKIAEESEFHFFTVEKTERTRMLCSLFPDGKRCNWGDAPDDIEKTVDVMLKKVFQNKED